PGDGVHWYFASGGHSLEETIEVGSCVSKNTWRTRDIMRQGWHWNRGFDLVGNVSYMSSTGQDCINGFKGVIQVQSLCPPADQVNPIPSSV
ncbi:hypothetical protein BGZ76_008446, partial [Entomortierella beljakovae]